LEEKRDRKESYEIVAKGFEKEKIKERE